MSGALRAFDRFLVLVVGAVLVAGGLGVLGLRFGLLGDRPTVVDATGVRSLLEQPWAYPALAAVGVLAAVLGLVWLWAHVPSRSASRVRLAGSDTSGRLAVDLDALADAVGERARLSTNLSGVSARARTEGYFSLVEVSGKLRPGTEPASLVGAAEQITTDLAAAFPDDGVTGRLLVSAPPRRPRTPSTGTTVVEGDDSSVGG